MDVFRWIAVVLSTVLGLGIARILTGYVAAFKMRDRINIDWLPTILAGAVLGEILQFWWALVELGSRQSWSLADFTILVALAMLLFLSAALISPSEADLDKRGDYFEKDGRWAMLVLALFHAVAIVANAWFWQQSVFSSDGLVVATLGAISLVAALIRRRSAQQVAAVAYCLISLLSTFIESPTAY